MEAILHRGFNVYIDCTGIWTSVKLIRYVDVTLEVVLMTKKKEEREYAKNREEYFREFHRVIAPVVVIKKYDE